MSDIDFHERFEKELFSKVPREVARSFTSEQISAVETLFGAERWDGHPIDFRGMVPGIKWYFAVVAGPDRRTTRRARKAREFSPLRRIMGAAVSTIALVWLALIVGYLLLPEHLLPVL